LDLLEKLVCRPFRTGNLTEAVLFRVLDDREPTVLIDEYDTIPEDRRDALANILKHGFHRAGRVHRIEGDAEKKIVEFVVFGPKALACIKLSTLDAATVSRCINIRMQRKRSSQQVARLRRYDGTEWQRKCLRWATDNRDRIEAATAELPDALGDREQDIWEPLFVLANLAGGEWPSLVSGAALALCEESGDAAQDTAVVLLRWIKTYFTDTGSDKVSSAKLVEWLNALVDASYASWGDGRGISQSDLRRHLAGFEIRPATIRLGAYTAKGYARDWFEDAFAAYLAETPDSAGNTVTTPANIDESRILPPVTGSECYQPEKCENPNEDADCYPVTAASTDSAPAGGLADQADLL
jgi:putative DNA primase/helicase